MGQTLQMRQNLNLATPFLTKEMRQRLQRTFTGAEGLLGQYLTTQLLTFTTDIPRANESQSLVFLCSAKV